MINVSDLTFQYVGGETAAIQNLAFDIDGGEIFGFLGPSGAGKSTTQKILIGLLRGYQGGVKLFDKDLSSWKQDLYERIGVAFEVPNLYLKLTALENLRYFASLYSVPTRSPEELLEAVNLADDGNMPVGQYSKGMRVRLNLARSMLHNPQILFLDEPTAGLDPVNARRVREIVKAQQAAGRTVFLTTHDMAVADELCDRVAFILDGQINLIDSPRALKLRYGDPVVRVEYGLNGQADRRDFSLDGLAENADFLTLLRNDAIQTIHSQEATLEDIFIRVTGRGLV